MKWIKWGLMTLFYALAIFCLLNAEPARDPVKYPNPMKINPQQLERASRENVYVAR